MVGRATFRSVVASGSHWLQPLLVLTIRWWHALVSVGIWAYNSEISTTHCPPIVTKHVAKYYIYVVLPFLNELRL